MTEMGMICFVKHAYIRHNLNYKINFVYKDNILFYFNR